MSRMCVDGDGDDGGGGGGSGGDGDGGSKGGGCGSSNNFKCTLSHNSPRIPASNNHCAIATHYCISAPLCSLCSANPTSSCAAAAALIWPLYPSYPPKSGAADSLRAQAAAAAAAEMAGGNNWAQGQSGQEVTCQGCTCHLPHVTLTSIDGGSSSSVVVSRSRTSVTNRVKSAMMNNACVCLLECSGGRPYGGLYFNSEHQ